MTVQRTFTDWPDLGLTAGKEPYSDCSPNLVELRRYLTSTLAGTKSLGCENNRPIRGGTKPSTHSYGAALDWDYPDDMRQQIVDVVLPWLVDNSAELGIDAIHDYVGDRIWRAGRTRVLADASTKWWKTQNGAGQGMGEAWATYLHIETHRSTWGDMRPIVERGIPLLDGAPPVVPPVGLHAGVPAPTLRLGSSGPAVTALVDQLKFWQWYPAEYLSDRNDGTFGERTAAGVRAMQGRLGLDPDGVYGPKTAQALSDAITALETIAPPPASPCPLPEAPLRPGDRNEAVRALQTTMAGAGWYLLNADGQYGPRTEQAVQQMQRAVRALGFDPGPVDGLYGVRTRSAVCAAFGH